MSIGKYVRVGLAVGILGIAAASARAQMLAQPDVPPFRGMPQITPTGPAVPPSPEQNAAPRQILPGNYPAGSAQAPTPAPVPMQQQAAPQPPAPMQSAPAPTPVQMQQPAPVQVPQFQPAPQPQLPPQQVQQIPQGRVPSMQQTSPPVAAGTADIPQNSVLSVGGPVGAAPPPRLTASGRILRHLPNNIQGYRLFGEIGSSEWPVYLTEAQTQNQLRFQVGYLASISAMPEASELTVSVNDKVIGTTKIYAPNTVKTVTFDIPRNLMKAGFNAVRISVEQRHRVDCSLSATYELWTQIDPSQTGLVIEGADPGVTDIPDLAAIPPDAQGALPIRAVIPPKTSLANVEYVLRAVQMIALIGRFEQPLVDFGPMADDPYGINLAIGTVDEISRQIGRVNLGPVGGPRLAVIPAQPGRRTTIVVTGATQMDVEQALLQFATAKERRGSEAGLRAAAAFPGLAVEGGQRVRLRDLGVSNEMFGGRFFRTTFNIVMPPDFYPADYAKVFLRLDGGYAAGLAPDAHIMIAINERNAASVPLPKSAGDVFEKTEIPVPLGLLRPGLNRIDVQAQVPFAADATCDPLVAISGKKRFMFLDTSELVLPPIARIGRMPDLAVTATGGFPFAGTGTQSKLFVPAPDKETMGAAATLVARLAVSAGRPIDFQLTLTPPPKGAGATLVVASAKAMSAEMFAAAGIDTDAMRRAWQDRIDAPAAKSFDERITRFEAAARNRLVLQRNFPAACHMSPPPRRSATRPGSVASGAVGAGAPSAMPAAITTVQTAAITGNVNAGAPAAIREAARAREPAQDPKKLFDEWNDNVRGQSNWGATFTRIADNLREWSQTAAGSMGDWVGKRLQSAPPPAGITSQTSLIVAQNILGDTTNDVWTFVTAPTSAILGESVGCLIDPRVWRQIDGRISMLDASEGKVKSVGADSARLVATQPLSIGNVRLIAASWLSLNQGVYVIMSLIVSVLLSAATVWLIRNVGRKQEM